MRVLLSWLRELVALPSDMTAEAVARRLTDAGLEVEAIERLDRGLEQVVAAEVRERTPVEGTKLSVCGVFDGDREWQVVCGAQNYAAGSIVPLARVGAVLPDGKQIGQAKLRGIESFGMLCSARELGFDDGVDGLHLLPAATVPGTPMARLLGRDDVALELNVTPNRADALSHHGVARELAALLELPLRSPATSVPPTTAEGSSPVAVEVAAPQLCPLYTGRVVTGVRIGPSPAWLQRRLEAMGQRPVNNVVDATNLVLLELGQPLHAFDLEKLHGGRLTVRTAAAGEELVTLDGKERALLADDLVIADAERAVALAGVMGGANSEVSESTTALMLESALFDPTAVRRTARRLSLHSEASHRFERGVDPAGVQRALDRLTALVVELAGGAVRGPAVVVRPRPTELRRVTLRRARLDGLVGTPQPWEAAIALLERLGLRVLAQDAAQAELEVPSHRGDLHEEVDLIEEVLRVRGLHTVESRAPSGSGTDASEDLTASVDSRMREALSAVGFDETVNYAFVAPEELARLRPEVAPLALQNPIAAELAVMRTTLLAGLLRNLGHNLRHAAGTGLRLYELGRVYLPREALEGRPGEARFTVAHEPLRLSLAACGPRGRGWTAGKESVDFYDVKGALEQLLGSIGVREATFRRDATPPRWLHRRSACVVELQRAGEPATELGRLGELHPALADALELPRATLVAELDADALRAAAVLLPRYRPLPRFPASLRDVAVVVDDSVTSAQVLAEIAAADADGLLEESLLFDVYKGAPLAEGRKNLAFALRYRAAGRTLTDEEINRAHAAIVDRLTATFGAQLRGA